MSAMNRELEDVVRRFGTQPGVTADQVEQLRHALTADRALAGSFNDAAATGHLRSISIEARTGAVPAGQLDVVRGELTLPAESFSGAGPVPSADLQSVIRVQGMVASFAASSYQVDGGANKSVSPSMVGNLQTAINESPFLADEIKTAARTRDPGDRSHFALEQFAVLPPSSSAGGTYSGSNHSMNLLASSLEIPDSPPVVRARDLRDLTFLVGHEVRHSFNHGKTVEAFGALTREIKAVSSSVSPVHDYTPSLRAYLDVARTDEAESNIAGWNALLSRERNMDPNFQMKEMPMILGRANDVVGILKDGNLGVREGFTLKPDGYIEESRENVAAMAVHYFDRPSPVHAVKGERMLGLGTSKALDYANYYLKEPVEKIVDAERSAPMFQGRRPELTINAAALGMREDLLEREGLNLKGVNAPVPYFDSSQLPSAPKHFDPGHGATAVRQQPIAREDLAPPTPEHPMLREVRALLPEGISEDRISQIALAAKQGGIEPGKIRTLDADGDRMLITGVTPGTRAEIDLSVPPPAAQESNRELNAIQIQQDAQVQQMQQGHAQQASQGMGMSM